jgi:hypothetical protein
MTALHSLQTDTIHIPYAWSYADATARAAATGFSSADLGKLARQSDNNTLWMLTVVTPVWVQVGGAGMDAGTLDSLDSLAFLKATGTVAGSTSQAQSFTAGGILTKQSVANVSNPPTDAELDSAFGTPATLGRGFVGLVDDNDDDTLSWICWTSDASWYYVLGTKAV